MTQVTKVYKQSLPAVRFIGIRYGDGDRENGTFGCKWGEWFEKNRFATLEPLAAGFEDGGAYIGLMKYKEGSPFEYWIGMFCKEGAEVPSGYEAVDFGPSEIAVAWIHGPESEVYRKEEEASRICGEKGWAPAADHKGDCWFFERYACPRFTTPDEQGSIILDIGHFTAYQP